MKVTRSTVRICCFIFGPLVLLSYVYTLSKMEEPMALWGGIPENLRSANVFCMFVAATGFLIMWRLFLYKWDVAVVESLNWPWKELSRREFKIITWIFVSDDSFCLLDRINKFSYFK